MDFIFVIMPTRYTKKGFGQLVFYSYLQEEVSFLQEEVSLAPNVRAGGCRQASPSWCVKVSSPLSFRFPGNVS